MISDRKYTKVRRIVRESGVNEETKKFVLGALRRFRGRVRPIRGAYTDAGRRECLVTAGMRHIGLDDASLPSRRPQGVNKWQLISGFDLIASNTQVERLARDISVELLGP